MDQPAATSEPSLKLKTARTLKWNTIDRVVQQVIYALVGIILANKLSQVDFGLVGSLLIFQALATTLTDGGFAMALLQKKEATQTDYSTVFWFNLTVSVGIYLLLWFGAPVIARIFQDDQRLIPLSRWMFLAFVLNGLCMVQTTRLMKKLAVRQVALSNMAGLTTGGIVGIVLACTGAGAWALVWQTVCSAAVRSLWLWIATGWRPSWLFSYRSLRSILPVGSSTLFTSILNTACDYAYNFAIGAFYSLRALGIYTQADKWSKMGSAAMSQILTSTFVPLLSRFADDPLTHRRYIGRINRLTALLIFPALGGLALVGSPLFHTLFGQKWDAAIILFQILSLRGILVVFIRLYYNYSVSLGNTKAMIVIEVTKDVMIFLAIGATIMSRSLETLVWGQTAASLLTFIIVLFIAGRVTGYNIMKMMVDTVPFILYTAVALGAGWFAGLASEIAGIQLILEISVSVVVYLVILKVFRVPELPEMVSYLLGRFRKNKTSE